MTAEGRLLNLRQAAGYIGFAPGTMRRLVKTRKIPVIWLTPNSPRFLMADLDHFIVSCKINRESWDEDSPELPWKVVGKLLKVAQSSISQMKIRGDLADYSPQSVRDYIRKQLRAEVHHEVQKEFQDRIDRQKQALQRFRARLKATRCSRCGKSLYHRPQYTGPTDLLGYLPGEMSAERKEES